MKKISSRYIIKQKSKVTLREKCPNMKLFLVRIFLYSDWIQSAISLRIQSEYRKIRTRNNSVLDTFHENFVISYLTWSLWKFQKKNLEKKNPVAYIEYILYFLTLSNLNSKVKKFISTYVQDIGSWDSGSWVPGLSSWIVGTHFRLCRWTRLHVSEMLF